MFIVVNYINFNAISYTRMHWNRLLLRPRPPAHMLQDS